MPHHRNVHHIKDTSQQTKFNTTLLVCFNPVYRFLFSMKYYYLSKERYTCALAQT